MKSFLSSRLSGSGWLVAAMGFFCSALVAEDRLKIAVIAAPEDAAAAAMLEAEVTKLPAVALLDRGLLETILAERELNLSSSALQAADAVMIVERAAVEDDRWLVARLAAARSSVILGILPVKLEDAARLGEWSQRAAMLVSDNRQRLEIKPSDVTAFSIVNFRAAYDHENLASLSRHTVMPRLLGEHLAASPAVVVLDRSSMQSSRLEGALKPLADAGVWKAGFVVDGTFQSAGEGLEATIVIRPGKLTEQPKHIKVSVPQKNHGDLAAAAAKAVLASINQGKAVEEHKAWNPLQEAARLEREALWLWDVHLPREAASLAIAAEELGLRTFSVQIIPIASRWLDAWTNLTDITWSRPDGGRITFHTLDPYGKKDETLLPGVNGMFNLLRKDNRNFRPDAGQFQSMISAIDAVADLVSAESAKGIRDSNPRRIAVEETFLIADMMLNLEYLHDSGDQTREIAIKQLRESARSLLETCKRTGLDSRGSKPVWMTTVISRSAAILADGPEEGWKAMLESLHGPPSTGPATLEADRAWWYSHFGVMSPFHEWVLGRHVNEHLPSSRWKPTLRPALFDWAGRDRERARETAVRNFASLSTSSDARVRLDGLALLGKHDCISPKAVERFQSMLAEIERSAGELARLSASTGLLDYYLDLAQDLDQEHNWTERDLKAGKTTLADAWTRALIAALNRSKQGSRFAFGFANSHLSNRNDRERWTKPLFDALMAHYGRPEVRADLPKFTNTQPEYVATQLSCRLAEKPAVQQDTQLAPIGGGKVIPIRKQWPSDSDGRISILGGADVHGDRVYLIEVDPAKKPEMMMITVLKLPELSVERSCPLKWKNGEIGTLLSYYYSSIPPSVHVGEQGRVLHLAFGKRFLEFDPSTGRVLHECVDEKLAKTEFSWCDGKWVGQTSHKGGLTGSFIAAVDVKAQKTSIIADTLRNPPLNPWDSGSSWEAARPIFCIGKSKSAVVFDDGQAAVFNMDHPNQWEKLAASSVCYHEAMDTLGSREWQGHPWVSFFIRNQGPSHERTLAAIHRETGESRLLLSSSSSKVSMIAGQVPKFSNFNQPPRGLGEPPGTWGGYQGIAAYDGRRLFYWSTFPDEKLRPRLHSWNEGTVNPVSFSLDFPKGKFFDPSKAETLLKEGRIAGAVNSLPPQAKAMWLTKHGLLVHVRTYDIQPRTGGIILLPWSDLPAQ